MTAMKRREMLVATGSVVLGASLFPLRWVPAADRKPQRVLYFTRNVGFYHSVVQRQGDGLSHSERILVELGKRHGIEVVCSKDGGVFDGDLIQFDAFAFYTNGDLTEPNPQKEPPMSAEGKKRFLEAVANGKGFVGFHSTCNSWAAPGPAYENNEQVDPFLAMLGAQFISHGPQQKATMRVASPRFPGVEGLGASFDLLEEWYAMKNFAQDLHVILVQETAGMQGDCYQRPPFPSTWARKHGQGRVFFTSMAHREDVWEGALFQQIVLGGLAWALGNAQADVTPNIETVTPQARVLRA
jgi:type 1 glutamine amidotransferase